MDVLVRSDLLATAKGSFQNPFRGNQPILQLLLNIDQKLIRIRIQTVLLGLQLQVLLFLHVF